MRSCSIALLPNAGLGNILFPWAHSRIFGAINEIAACAIGWNRLRPGPLLRGERRMRYYGNSFKESKSAIALSGLLSIKGTIVRNPNLERLDQRLRSDHLYVWDQIPHWSNYFGALKEYRDLVKELLWEALTPSLRRQVIEAPTPAVAVHIRRGDFRNLQLGEEFARVGSTRTPLEYFIELIHEIRRCCGFDVPVTVFTDGYASEIADVLALPCVRLAERNRPIVDLLLMSRAQLLIVSASSTFGYWSGFLSGGPIILHPEHIHASLRPQSINDEYFEGAAVGSCDAWPSLLIRNIQNLRDELITNESNGIFPAKMIV